MVGKCIYDFEHQAKLAGQVIDAVLATAEAFGPDADAGPAPSFHRAFLSLEADIIRISALVKHHSFREENEWRVISEVFANHVEAPIKYREGLFTLVPYVELPLSDGVPLFDHVFLGPTPSGDLSIAALTKYLAKTGAAARVTNSMSPLRMT